MNMKGKGFLIGIKKLVNESIIKRKLNKYYLEKNTSGKTYLAVFFDAILIKIVFVIIFFIYFFIRTSDYLFSGIITIQFLILYCLILFKVRKIKMKKIVDEVNYQVAKRKIYKDLINKTPYEFIEEIKSNLEKCSFEDLHISNDKDVDLLGKFKGNIFGIRCFQHNNDYKININIVREFFLTLKKLDIEEGMIITTSAFSEDVNEFLPKLENCIKIHPVNIDRLLNIMKKAGSYPSEYEIEKIILNHIKERRKKLNEYRDTVLSKGKSFKYIIIGVIINMFGKFTPYTLYYEIVSYILIFLGLISTGNYLVNLLKSNTENKADNIF